MPLLIQLYRFALRSGNRPLAERLEPMVRAEADRSLEDMPRGEARWSAGAERAMHRALARLAN